MRTIVWSKTQEDESKKKPTNVFACYVFSKREDIGIYLAQITALRHALKQCYTRISESHLNEVACPWNKGLIQKKYVRFTCFILNLF